MGISKKFTIVFVALLVCVLFACALVACNPSSNNQNGGLNDGNDGDPDDGGEIYYTVTFDSQGGSMVQSVRVKSGDKLTAPANPTRTSYNFSGWYKDSAYTKIWDFSVEQVTQDITLYARWIAEDGKIIAVENAKIDGLDIFMAVRNEVTDVRLANAVTIGGNAVWKLYLDKLGTQEIPTKIAASTNGILREGDNVFYIVSTSSDGQQVRTYTLTIHRSYYATVSVYDPYDKLYNTYIRETYFESFTPPAAFTGYTITSWNVSDDRWQNDGLIRQNTQFKPICQANKYTVNLNAQGGQCSSTSATLTYDSSYKLPVPTKTGYVFMGWSAYTSGGSFVTDDCGYSKANWKNAQSGGTLYAIWALGSYEVTARANDETAGVVVGGGTYKYGSSVTLSATTNAGYTFVGWYEGEEKLSGDLTYSFTMPEVNVTYTAKWIKVDILSENTAKGTVTGLTGAYKPGDEATVTAKTNAGYTFVGWYENDEKLSGDLTYTFTMPEVNVTYTAVWQMQAEMEVFMFSSTPTVITILGVNDSDISAITIPSYSGVSIQIAEKAFSGCKNLISVTMGNGVTSIGQYAFEGCSGLTSVTIGSGVTSIGSSAFSGCRSLEAITIPFVGAEAGKTSSDTYQYPFGYIFGTSSYTGGTAVEQRYYGSSTSSTTSTTYYIPSSLRSVTVTGGNILYGAFYNCSGLTSVTIPDSVTSIGSSAFYNCSGLTSVTIGDSVTSIGYDAFYNCSGLTSVTIGNGVTSIEWYAFYGCSGLTSITIPDSVTSIGSSAFSGCSGLTSITIPDSVTNIGDHAFKDCSGLTSITIPDSVTSIKSSAFYDCSGLTSITIPDSVTSIGSSAFRNCSGLTSITIPDSVTSIGSSAFYGTAWYNSQPNGVVYAGKVAYKYKGTMPNNTSIVLREGTLGIADSAFAGCSGLTSITIGDGVTSIGSSAFGGCSGLTTITIPDSVTSIGIYAFSGCSGLTSVIFKNTNNWQVSEYSNFIRYTGLSRSYLSNRSTAATYLKATFGDYYWRRA